ncbi:hypothetical protein M125_1298 [Bacteroides fragilis str. 3998T(B)3]|uniref:Uncharacterized protein n=1 Tax=Bacteroides fragilis str. 3998T(B)3 TaxID=1339316 RepID=A0A015U594_BACFG|nr:hypothetical protein M125_1298 [Bacteroides fragilis str. 3998T(B)3]
MSVPIESNTRNHSQIYCSVIGEWRSGWFGNAIRTYGEILGACVNAKF